MLAEEGRYEDLTEDDLKLMNAENYEERSKIRSLIRNIKKSRGELKETSNAGYKRHHQIEPSTFKLDQPGYYNHSINVTSNRRKMIAPHTPNPKHWIPGMKANANGSESDQSTGCSSHIVPTRMPVERTQSCEREGGILKDQAGRTQSYGFEQALKQTHSPDLGYPESPRQSLERPSESSDHTEGSDYPNQDREISNPQSHSESESQPELSLEPEVQDDPIEPTSRSPQPASNPIHSSSRSYNQPIRDYPLSKQDDGELDQLTQKLAYSENPEEQVQLRKQIRETRERTGKGRMQKHTSFIKIDVKKGGSRAESSPLSSLSPEHHVEDFPIIQETSVENGEKIEPSEPREVEYEYQSAFSSDNSNTSSVEQQEVVKPQSASPDDLSDELEDVLLSNQTQYTEATESGVYPDHTQIGSEKPVVGRSGKRPTFKGDGSIDFTTVLVKSQKSPDRARYSPRLGVEQHSFKNVLHRTSSPSQAKKSPEPQQLNFRDVLTNKVITNQHKIKTPPLVPTRPDVRNETSDSPVANIAEEYEDSLPQQMKFNSEPLQRSPSPDQLPAPSQELPNSNYNNCQEDTRFSESQDSYQPEDSDKETPVEDSAAVNFRRDSLQMGQDSRRRLREFNKQNSLSKLRMSLTDDKPLLPTSEDSIPEERPVREPDAQFENPYDEIAPSYDENPSSYKSEVDTQKGSEPGDSSSSYELRRLERRRKRELSGRNKTEDDLQLKADAERYMNGRDKKSGDSGVGMSVKSARDSYLKTAGIKNDLKNSRSPTASPNSHSGRTLSWAQTRTTTYNVVIKDLTTSWRDGLAFCALIHSFVPERFDFDSLTSANPKDNLELAFQVASEYGVDRLMDPEDILEMTVPDQRCIMTYLSTVYKAFA